MSYQQEKGTGGRWRINSIMSRGEEYEESVGKYRLDPVLGLLHPHRHIRVQKAITVNAQRYSRVYEYIST
jgi:hypothetical protein